MIEEVWIPVRGYPRYQVSQLGRVYDNLRDGILGITPDRNGYVRVKMWTPDGERKTVSVHRIVAGSFFDISDSEFDVMEVNHVDTLKENCAIWNLEFTDRSGNMLHAFAAGVAIPAFPVQRVRCVETGMIFDSTGQADRYLGVSSGSVSKTVRGIQPTCKGLTFEYF